MESTYIVKAKKIVTVAKTGTICDAAVVVDKGKIKDIGKYDDLKKKYDDLEVIDYEDYVITPSLVDCHTHILEYAPSSLYSVTPHTHLMGGISLLLHTLSSGITALGDQVCGHPECDFTLQDYKNTVNNLPIDISFSTNTISIGLDPIVHFTSITGSQSVNKNVLTEEWIIEKISGLSEYPGENIFINATPANLKEFLVPNAGNIMYSQDDLNGIANIFHKKGKKIGAHVGGKKAIEMAIKAGIDILHHAHGIDEDLINLLKVKNTMIVVTPIGGTHYSPNSPEEVAKLAMSDLTVAIATDSYLSPSKKASWLPFDDDALKGPEVLMTLAYPSMKILENNGWDENRILSLITLNGAKVLGKEQEFGSIEKGKFANFLVSDGIPGLEIIDTSKIRKVYFKGNKVIDKGN